MSWIISYLAGAHGVCEFDVTMNAVLGEAVQTRRKGLLVAKRFFK